MSACVVSFLHAWPVPSGKPVPRWPGGLSCALFPRHGGWGLEDLPKVIRQGSKPRGLV